MLPASKRAHPTPGWVGSSSSALRGGSSWTGDELGDVEREMVGL